MNLSTGIIQNICICLVIYLKIYVQIVSGNSYIEKYFIDNESVKLKCFPDQTVESLYDEFYWKIGGYRLTEVDIQSYSEYDDGENRGDIIINNAPNEERTATCMAKSNEKWSMQNQYLLRLGSIPNVRITVSGIETSDQYKGTEYRVVSFQCEALNGRPLSTLTLFLDADVLQSAGEAENITVNLTLNPTYNGKELTCQVDHFAKTISKKVHLDVQYTPHSAEEEPEHSALSLGKSLNLTFHYLSNPAPAATTWYYSNNCSDTKNDVLEFGEKFIQTGPSPYMSDDADDRFFSTLSMSEVSEEDLDSCISLKVTNNQGSVEFKRSLRSLSNSESDGLGTGLIAAIVLIIIGALATALVSGLFLWKKSHGQKTDGYSVPNQQPLTNISG